MAGSRKWFKYTADSGDVFAINLDESNTEAVSAATGDFVTADAIINAIPKNIKPRYAEFGNADRTIRRRCVCLTPADYTNVAPATAITDGVSGQTLVVIRKVGEQITIPFAVDSGLIDGDAT